MEPSEMSFKSIGSSEITDSVPIGIIELFFLTKIHILFYVYQDNPSARVQFLLGDEDQDDDDEEHKPHDLFIELNELISDGEKAQLNQVILVEQGWKETAR